MHRRLFFNNVSFAFETTLLLPEAAFKDGICCQNLLYNVSARGSYLGCQRGHTTSNFFSSSTSDSLDEPCHTRTLRPSVWAAISFFHCITATVGLFRREWEPALLLKMEKLTQRRDLVFEDLRRIEIWSGWSYPFWGAENHYKSTRYWCRGTHPISS